jgi:hypothetical protein
MFALQIIFSMNITNQLPKNLEKTISDLARAREKAAKQKYLLDLGESLVMHLCSFVLGEYKETGLVSIELEKSFLKNGKNVSFGIYLGWLRESSKFLYQQKQPSEIQELLHGSNELPELSKFVKAYGALKSAVENDQPNYADLISQALKNNLGKVNLLEFFDVFIQLRNRVAHPHKEVKGKIVSWPFSEEYFDATNPFLESALNQVINELGKIWEFRQFVVDSNEQGVLTLISEDSNEPLEVTKTADYPEGIKVFAANDTVLLSDWKLLLRAGKEAVEKIRQEEEELRNKATVEDLKESIKAALDDEQISLDELNFFESIGKTRMGLSKEQVKALIVSVATELNIEDPFPEVDKRFIEVVDHAITTKTYNEFLLKLTGQQYGVDNVTFDKVFLERTFALNVDPDEVRRNKVLQFTIEELTDFQGLMAAHKWLIGMGVFRHATKESIFKIREDSYKFGTKEYWHRTAFASLDHFVQSRLKKLCLDEDSEWDTKQNNWQIGVMTGYAWCTLYPKNLPSKKILALHFSLYSSGGAAIGYLPDWKDYKDLENYGLLLNVFVEHLKSFAMEYSEDLKKYPNLVLWDSLNNNTYYSFTESMSRFPWFYDFIYGFDQIQFYHKVEEIIANPSVLIDSFDIAFNLFKGVFEAVNRDYQNMLNGSYVIDQDEALIRSKLTSLEDLLLGCGLSEATEEDLTSDQGGDEVDEGMETQDSSDNQLSNDGLKGSVHLGYFSREFRPRIKGYPLCISFQIKQDYFNNELNYLIYISCAGYLQPEIHEPVERILESLEGLSFENARFHFKRSKFLVQCKVEDLERFDPRPLTSFFLTALADACSKSYVSFLGLKLTQPVLTRFGNSMAEVLEEINPSLQGLFSNTITRERNWMKGYRFLDYVYSGKGVAHWLGWGLEFQQDQMMAGVVLHVGDSLKGAQLMEQMQNKANNDSSWKFVTKGESALNDAHWILANSSAVMNSSSDYNRNYKAHHALISNEKTYWCAAKQDDKQWWQVELPEAMSVSQLVLKGAPHGKSYVTRFHIMYSVDKKNWQTLSDLEGLNDGFSTLELTFESAFNAKFIKIIPVAFFGWPGFRVDFWGKKIVPSKIELQHWVPVNNEQELPKVLAEFEHKIKEIKAFKGLGF